MLPSRSLLLGCALSLGCAAASIDFPDLTSYAQPCEPFTCRPKRAPAPVKDFEFTANGCGTSGMPITTSTDFQECCDWHDACYSTCGMPKGNCEKRLQKCMKTRCKEIQDPSKREECFSTAKIFYIGANMIACPAYQDAQKEACECVPTDKVAETNRERLVYFLEENGAPEEELEDEAIDTLLKKYKGQEPTMFLRLLKKYPKALKDDPHKTNFMDDIVKNAEDDLGPKKAGKKKKHVGSSATSLTYSGLQMFTPYSFKLAARSSMVSTARVPVGEPPSGDCMATSAAAAEVAELPCDRMRWYCMASCVTSSSSLCAAKEIIRVLHGIKNSTSSSGTVGEYCVMAARNASSCAVSAIVG
uniref:Phospholipase A2 n=1 Tax=Phytophthora ramorum TaxID=164328 RepID=H3GN10_PHYRM